jgi:hypothetical protein
MRGSLSEISTYASGAANQTHQEQQNDCASNRNQQTGNVEACDPLCPEHVRHEEASNDGANNANNDVGKRAHLGILPHDDAGNPPSQSPKYDPYKPIHFYLRVTN